MPRPQRPPRRPSASGAPRRIVVVKSKKGSGSTNASLAVLTLAIGGIAYFGYKHAHDPAAVAQAPAATAPAQVAPPEEAPADSADAKPKSDTGAGMGYIAPELPAVASNEEKAAANPKEPAHKTAAQRVLGGTPESIAAEQATMQLDDEHHLATVGIEATTTAAKKRDADLMAMAIKAGAWQGYEDLLMRSLSGNWAKVRLGDGRTRFDALWNEPVFYQDFLRWQVLFRFHGVQLGYSEKTKAVFTYLLNNNDAMEEVLLTLKPQDDKQKVAELLGDYQAAHPDKFDKYFNLALACAVVFDKTVSIPAASQSERFPSTVDPMARYNWYIEKNEKGKLLNNIEKTTSRDLVWVVCAPVADTELDWAIEKMHLTRSGWGSSYDKVKYLMERAVKGTNPYNEYSLAEILKKGGICGDRSYFCVNTARAHGIPAMTISGETDLGGHAWAGVKIRDNEWTTMVGRIGGASKGQADNPQVGGQTSEQEIWLWNDRAQQSAVATRNVFKLLWLADYLEQVDQVQQADSAIRLANEIGRPFSETWLRLRDLLLAKTERTENKADPALLKDWQGFVADMRHEFRENPRMAELATKAETEHVFPFISADDARKDLARDRRRMERNAAEQKDLIAASVRQEADVIKEKGDPNSFDEISSLYEKSLRAYGGSITGFKAMAEDYMSYVGENQTVARKAAREIELAFDRVVRTGSKDWFRANTETDIYKMICGYYRKGGDEARAEMLEKQYQRLLRDAERGAL